MESGASGMIGSQLAVALAAGTLAATPSGAAPAIRDRRDALKRAIARRSAKIRLDDLEDDPTSRAHRLALGSELDEHGASKDRDVVTTAKELLGLIKVDAPARDAVGTMIDDVEQALVTLSQVDLEADVEPRDADVPKPGLSKPEVSKPLTTSRRLLPPAEHSKTELERLALPIWQRTERFFTKLGIVVALVVAGGIAWVVLTPSPNEAMEGCRGGDKARCWQVVTAADADAVASARPSERGGTIPEEPLRRLCDRHQDACGCAGLAYVLATQTEGASDCSGLVAASALDPRWPCTCRRYDFWRAGEQRTTQCGVPRCE